MIVNEAYHLDTDDLASHSRFFPAEINVRHYQLRNFISTVYNHKIYLVHDFDVLVVDLRSNERALVVTIPFEARCLAAAHGWVCVGGEEKGNCAFVKIGDSEAEAGQFATDLIVDMLGKQIVNSMTIHRICAKTTGQEDEVVVLISNNDKTVTVYSLSQREVLTVLTHSVAMNYASMSPDCSLMAAVGDSNEIHFYERKETPLSKSMSGEGYAEYDWPLLAKLKIPFGDGISDDYSFAIAFSPNGRLCAVSAHGGLITVLDLDHLRYGASKPEAAIVCTFKSSRSSSLWGCVRSMAFCPDPWDLLVWTEDHGRIGIADVRRSFIRRQHIELDREASKTILLVDVTPAEYSNPDVKERLKYQHLQRARAQRGNIPVGARSFGEMQQSEAQAAPLSSQSMDLDSSEQSVVDALDATIGGTEVNSLRPYSVNYTSSPGIRPSAMNITAREYHVQLLNPSTHSAERSIPRRRNSVILSDSAIHRSLTPLDNFRSFMTASPAPMSEDNSTPPMSTNDLTPSTNSISSQPMPYNIPASDPWHVIEAALGTANRAQAARSSAVHNPSLGLAQIESALIAERRIATRLERLLADERRLSASLRHELEARERLLEARQQRTEAGQTIETRLSPPLEQVLQQQLQMEQENCRRRSLEIESEIRINSQRMERLHSARDTLTERLRSIGGESRYNIATSSALPTMTATSSVVRELESTLSILEEDRRTQRQRIQDLETQVRRAESRVQAASIHQSPLRSAANRYHERLTETRFLASVQAGGGGQDVAWQIEIHDTDPPPAAAAQSPSRADTGMGGTTASRRNANSTNIGRGTRARDDSFPGPVSDSDMALARIMLSRHSADTNGNWVAQNGFRRLMGQSRRSSALTTLLGRQNATDRSLEEMMREGGLGTAGVGWSPDGRFLYVGTEAGLFEFKVNIRDRMFFPATDLR